MRDARPAAPRLTDADREAIELLSRLVERVEVARSFARITAGILHQQASQASAVLRGYAGAAVGEVAGGLAGGIATGEERLRAQLARFQKVARATAQAAAHAAAESDARRHARRTAAPERVGRTTIDKDDDSNAASDE